MIVSEEQVQRAFDFVMQNKDELGRLFGRKHMYKEIRDIELAIAYENTDGTQSNPVREKQALASEHFVNAMDRLEKDLVKFKALETAVQLAFAKYETYRTECANNRRLP